MQGTEYSAQNESLPRAGLWSSLPLAHPNKQVCRGPRVREAAQMPNVWKQERNLMKKVIAIVIVFILVLVIFGIIEWIQYKNQKDDVGADFASALVSNEIQTSTKTNEPITINMAVVGDIICHNTQYWDVYNKQTDTYDFSPVFTEIKQYIENADIAVGNLETSFAGKMAGYSSYPMFNTPEELAANLKDIGFDVLSDANNHALDKGYAGIVSTINFLDQAGISHVGTYTSEEARNTVLVKDVNGIKLAFLSYTYGTNGISIPNGKDYCINLIDKGEIAQDIQNAKAQDVDGIVCFMHWGTEYSPVETAEQKDLTDFLFKNGVDIILGSHPHVLEPMEKVDVTTNDGEQKQCFVCCCLGDFMSDQRVEDEITSAILNIQITKTENGKIDIGDVTYTPIYTQNDYKGIASHFIIRDVNKDIAAYENGDKSISTGLYQRLVNARDLAEKRLGQ